MWELVQRPDGYRAGAGAATCNRLQREPLRGERGRYSATQARPGDRPRNYRTQRRRRPARSAIAAGLGVITSVIEKVGDGWRIIALQNTAVAAQPPVAT